MADSRASPQHWIGILPPWTSRQEPASEAGPVCGVQPRPRPWISGVTCYFLGCPFRDSISRCGPWLDRSEAFRFGQQSVRTSGHATRFSREIPQSGGRRSLAAHLWHRPAFRRLAGAHRAQADALEIESVAKRRLADEYDAAQERGEIRKHGERTVSAPETVGYADIGLTHKDIHEARLIRDAEASVEPKRALWASCAGIY
jgi:hypothetical protein